MKATSPKTPAWFSAFQCLLVSGLCIAGASTHAAPVIVVTQGEEADLAALYDSTDLIQDLIATELPGDLGWHPANSDPADKLPAFTDGEGVRSTGLTGLLADFPPPGSPAKLIRYTLTAPADISEIRVFTGNNGRDGRVFHTYTVRFSSDNAASFSPPIYVQSHPSGTLNNQEGTQWRVVLSQLTETDGPLATQVTDIDFDFYAVDNTGGQMRDPFDGVNPFTGVDDGLSAAFVSPLVWEIDVLQGVARPTLSATRVENDLLLSWPGLSSGVVIQTTASLTAPDWQDLDPQPLITSDGDSNSARVPIGAGPGYFRLRL